MYYGWNKETAFNKGVYKNYKIRMNDFGMYAVKPYYSLQILSGGEEYEIRIPPYEREEVERLTGRTAE